MKKLGRLLTAMVTPFQENGDVDYEQTKRLAKALLASGNDGLVLAATTGEAPTLSWDEEMRIFTEVKSAVRETATLVAYTGSNSTKEAVENTEKAEKIGVDACLSVVPYYNKPNQEGIYRHFKAIAESTSLPIIMYNIPGRVVVNMTPDTIVRLSRIKNIVGVKEANGDMGHVAQVIENVSKIRDDFHVWSGNDNDTFPIMALGGYGVIGVTTHLTGLQYKKMVELILSDHIQEAAAIQRKLVPLVNAMFSVPSPAPIKYALNKLGFNVGKPRLPLVEVTPAEAAKIDAVLKGYTFDIKA
ncbi:MAG: 4-hydroxy-tetrahydrodipicolinate synthase [Dehalococcoidales bacterium]|jgi:4-hydroxy-tetrahydrodipicolinate synthase